MVATVSPPATTRRAWASVQLWCKGGKERRGTAVGDKGATHLSLAWLDRSSHEGILVCKSCLHDLQAKYTERNFLRGFSERP